MSPSDLAILKEILLPAIRGAVAESIREEKAIVGGNGRLFCTCPVSDKRLPAIPRLLDMIEDAGGGDLIQGIAEVRENIAWTSDVRESTEKNKKAIIGGVLSTVAMAATGVLLAVIGWGNR